MAQAINSYLSDLPNGLREALYSLGFSSLDGQMAPPVADDLGFRYCPLPDETSANQPTADQPTQESRDRAASTIARLHGNRRGLQFLSVTPNPYRDDGSLIDIYADDQGNEYWFDTTDGILVQVGPRADNRPTPHAARPAGRIPIKDLREQAVRLITTLLPEFPTKRSSLHPLEDNRKGQVYFFRWDDFSAPIRESELPPFIQIGLRSDGILTSYTNTLRV